MWRPFKRRRCCSRDVKLGDSVKQLATGDLGVCGKITAWSPGVDDFIFIKVLRSMVPTNLILWSGISAAGLDLVQLSSFVRSGLDALRSVLTIACVHELRIVPGGDASQISILEPLPDRPYPNRFIHAAIQSSSQYKRYPKELASARPLSRFLLSQLFLLWL